MNHQKDYDRDHDREDALNKESLKKQLEDSLDTETEMMKKYLITADRIHDNKQLKQRLENFSEGNAKRSQQLQDELDDLK